MGSSRWGGSSLDALLGHRLRGRSVRAPLIVAGNISSGDGRNEILLLFHPLCRVGRGNETVSRRCTREEEKKKSLAVGSQGGPQSVERVVVGVGRTVMRDARMDEQFPGPGGPS